jgi:HsdM N-terminal domain
MKGKFSAGSDAQSEVSGEVQLQDIGDVEKRLWAAADQLWANTGLKPSEFSTPVLGLIFVSVTTRAR